MKALVSFEKSLIAPFGMNCGTKLLTLFLICHLFTSYSIAQTSRKSVSLPMEHSLITELTHFLDISFLPYYLDNTKVAQVSSWDTTGNNDDGFSGKYSFLRRNADGSLVIFDQHGPGVINRIWTPTPNSDTLDFFIDNDLNPSFSVSFSDLFSGKQYPFIGPLCGNQLGGFFCYMPILFEKSCKIVSRGKIIQFHQIQYRIFEPGSKVRSFNPALSDKEKETLEKIADLWNKKEKRVQDFYPGKVFESMGQFSISGGETKTVFELNKGGRILGIELGPVTAFEGLEKNIDIRITWDGEKNPAIYCPVADFFGYAFGKSSMQSLLLGSTGDQNYCYFPMPFDKNAKIEIINRQTESIKKEKVQLSFKIAYSLDKRVAEKEGKFYAHWNKNIKSQSGYPHVFADLKGKGHITGVILQAQGKRPGMTYFFEGDDSTAIDGEFRMHGTGSEDFFNGGWYAMMDRWDAAMSLPLHGALDYSLPFNRTGGYRLYLSDKLTFEKSIFQSIEHGPVGNEFPVDYTSVLLYYSDTPSTASIPPDNLLSKVYIPDTLVIYPQLMDYNLYGKMDIRTTWKYGTGGESYLFTPGSDSWLRISLADMPKGKYKVLFDFMKEPNGCEFSLWQRQTQISEWRSSYSAAEEREKSLYMCDLELTGSVNSLTIRFRTTPQKTDFLLNRITLINK